MSALHLRPSPPPRRSPSLTSLALAPIARPWARKRQWAVRPCSSDLSFVFHCFVSVLLCLCHLFIFSHSVNSNPSSCGFLVLLCSFFYVPVHFYYLLMTSVCLLSTGGGPRSPGILPAGPDQRPGGHEQILCQDDEQSHLWVQQQQMVKSPRSFSTFKTSVSSITKNLERWSEICKYVNIYI